jgi:hypothetical protein
MRASRLLLFLLCLLPLAAHAAIGQGTPCTGIASGADTISIPGCTASGVDRAVVTGIMNGDNSLAVTSITYGGAAMTLVASAGFPPPDFETRQYYLLAPATGPQTLAVNFTGNTTVYVGVLPLTGVHQTTPIGTPVTSQGGGITSRSVVVTSTVGELVADVLGLCDSAGLTVGAGQTVSYTNDRVHASTEPGAASVTMSWTWTSSDCGMIVATPFKPAAAAAAPRRGSMMVFP